nr:transposase [Methanosarcina spelaei]
MQISLKANKTQNSYLFIDVTDLKIEYGPHYKNKALFVVTGIRNTGYRETLGARLANSEDSFF